MRVRITQMIGDDAELYISLVINVSRCQPSARFETGVRIPAGTPAIFTSIVNGGSVTDFDENDDALAVNQFADQSVILNPIAPKTVQPTP
jgi:hypothetical protein